jgi:prevent-host-death family protein
MHNLTMAQVRDDLADVMRQVSEGRERVMVTRHGREYCAIVPVADVRAMERAARALDDVLLEAALQERRAGGEVSWDEMVRMVREQRTEGQRG